MAILGALTFSSVGLVELKCVSVDGADGRTVGRVGSGIDGVFAVPEMFSFGEADVNIEAIKSSSSSSVGLPAFTTTAIAYNPKRIL